MSYEIRSLDPETGHIRAVEPIADEQEAWSTYTTAAHYATTEGGAFELVRMSDGEKLASVHKEKPQR